MKIVSIILKRLLRSLPLAVCLILARPVAVLAASTDIANAPLFTSSATAVPPNIMFILDDSGSMKSDYLPDEAGAFRGKYGATSAWCNGVAYNPDIVYQVPVDYLGNPVANGSLAFNPSEQLSANRTLPSAIVSVPAVGSSITVQPQGWKPKSSWYDVGDVVTVWEDGSTFFTGTVTSWNASNRNLVINVTYAQGTTMPSPNVGAGEPLKATYYKYTGTESRLGFTYLSNGNMDKNGTLYKQCASSIGYTPGKNVFTQVTVTTSSPEATNYANWNAYYRTRMQMMKSAVSLAFRNIDSRYRVGYSTISEDSVAEGDNFLNIRDFDLTQKQKFYETFNKANPISWTALRGALSKAGQYYAKKAPGQSYDPMQFSCQRNFTILSTDGYWNTPDETTTYGPYGLDGKAVKQQDGGTTKRPMYDGGAVTATTTETWTTTVETKRLDSTPSSSVTTSSTTSVVLNAQSGGATLQTTKVVMAPVSLRPSAFTRTGGVVVVTTSSNHNLQTGDTVSVSGGGSSSFNAGLAGTFTITRISATQFSFPSTGPDGTGADKYWYIYHYKSYPDMTVDLAAPSCPSGQTLGRTALQVQNASFSTTTVTSSVRNESTVTQAVTVTDITSYERVTKVQNGVETQNNLKILSTSSSTQNNGSPVTQTASVPLSTSTTSPTTPANPSAFVPVSLTTGCYTSFTPGTSSETLAAGSTTVKQTVSPPTTSATTVGAPVQVVTSKTSTDDPDPHLKSTTESTDGGSENSLADVAMYYYEHDLRDASLDNCTGGPRKDGSTGDVCKNNVPGETNDAAHSFGDNNPRQHMSTFTLGLGLSGLLKYDPDYQTQQSGSFYDILSNGKNWPIPGDNQTAENIDDLWHAAVNGRGQYFSAGDPNAVAASLNAALEAIKQVTGAASAASTSSLQPVEGDNDIYVAQFTTALWVGDVLSYKIDPVSGKISKNYTWSAKSQLDALPLADRKVYYAGGSGSSRSLKSFTYANLSSDGYGSYFDNFCSVHSATGDTVEPQQCAILNTTDKTAANTGTNLVNYLRGDRSLTYYRKRTNLLGDIINASPLFIGKPAFKYTENDYAAYVSANAGRQAVVLAAANDGMLHAFDRDTGNELWAFVPSFVLQNMYKLADTGYAGKHAYFVDGSPQIADIYADDNDGKGPHWKTIVVGGLNAGGRGYYALDVTDPAAPKLLWEFSNNNLGLTFGNPIITKRTSDNRWVVVFSSGYNNVSPGDGNGHLFVVDANTGGAPLSDIQTFTSGSTPAGTTSDPSGLAKINAWVDSETMNLAQRFYGGDLKGNVWRFDFDNIVAPQGKALLLGQLTDSSGNPQPVTVKPGLAEVSYNGNKYPVVYVPTGRYLGTADLDDNSVQSVYAIKDPMTDFSYGVVRNNANFVAQTIVASGNTRVSSNDKVDWTSKAGWRVDFPVAGERVSVNPQLVLDTLFVGTNIPLNDACTVGGNSFLYEFNIVNGSSTAYYIGNVLVQGLTVVQLTTGAGDGSLDTIITRSDGSLDTKVDSPSSGTAVLRRTSWRELSD
jgi:type IV pilus assembly protein PilY1